MPFLLLLQAHKLWYSPCFAAQMFYYVCLYNYLLLYSSCPIYFCLCLQCLRCLFGPLGHPAPERRILGAPDHPFLWVRKASSFSCPGAMAVPPPRLWGVSRKDQNRLAHITHGNTTRPRGEECRPSRLSIGTANVTSLHSQNHCVGEFQSAAMLLQETRISDLSQAAMRGLLRHYKWDVLWGHGVPSAHVGGVAVLVKPEHSATQILPSTPKGIAAYSAGRLMIAAIALNRGSSVLYVVNVYGHSGITRAEQREELISTVFREAAALGDVAIAIGGDWNTESQNSAAIGRALGSGAWHDVGAAAGVGAVPTFEGPQGSSRIDNWLVSSTLPPLSGASLCPSAQRSQTTNL